MLHNMDGRRPLCYMTWMVGDITWTVLHDMDGRWPQCYMTWMVGGQSVT